MSEEMTIKEELSRLEAERELKEFQETLTANDIKSEVVPVDTKIEKMEVSELEAERKFSEVELEQMEKGWDPNFKGPNAVTAEEYKRVGEIIEAKRKASKEVLAKSQEVEDLRKTLKQVIADQRKTEQIMYDKAVRDLYAQKLRKIEEGDVSAVQEIERQQAALTPPAPIAEDANPAPTAQEIAESPEVVAFKEECKEFLNGKTPQDLAMQGYVQMMANKFQAEQPDIDINKALDQIREGLREAFPNRFKNPRQDQPSAVLKSTTSRGVEKSVASLSRLDTDMRMEFTQIKKADPSYTLEEYVKQLELVGRLK